MRYRKICKDNNYKVDGYEIFSIKEFKYQDLFKTPFAIITAWNPNNNKLNIEENEILNDNLLKKIINYKYKYAKGFLDQHYENGFLIFNIDFIDAIDLGNEFNQIAIFYNDTKKAGYYYSKSKEEIISINIV